MNRHSSAVKLPPERERHPEYVEEVVGHADVAEPLRIARAGQRLPAAEIEEGEVPGQCVEARVLFAPRFERVGAGRARRHPAGALVLDPYQATRIPERQRPQQHRIDDAEHCRAGADAEREREQGDSGEPRRLDELSERELEIGHGSEPYSSFSAASGSMRLARRAGAADASMAIDREDDRDGAIRERVGWRQVEQHRRDDPSGAERCCDPGQDAEADERQ